MSLNFNLSNKYFNETSINNSDSIFSKQKQLAIINSLKFIFKDNGFFKTDCELSKKIITKAFLRRLKNKLDDSERNGVDEFRIQSADQIESFILENSTDKHIQSLCLTLLYCLGNKSDKNIESYLPNIDTKRLAQIYLFEKNNLLVRQSVASHLIKAFIEDSNHASKILHEFRNHPEIFDEFCNLFLKDSHHTILLLASLKEILKNQDLSERCLDYVLNLINPKNNQLKSSYLLRFGKEISCFLGEVKVFKCKSIKNLSLENLSLILSYLTDCCAVIDLSKYTLTHSQNPPENDQENSGTMHKRKREINSYNEAEEKSQIRRKTDDLFLDPHANKNPSVLSNLPKKVQVLYLNMRCLEEKDLQALSKNTFLKKLYINNLQVFNENIWVLVDQLNNLEILHLNTSLTIKIESLDVLKYLYLKQFEVNGLDVRLSLAIKKNNSDKVVSLITNGAKPSGTLQEKLFLQKICEEVLITIPELEKHRPFFTKLIEQRALPFGTLGDNTLVITHLFHNSLSLGKLINQYYRLTHDMLSTLIDVSILALTCLKENNVAYSLKTGDVIRAKCLELRDKGLQEIENYFLKEIQLFQQKANKINEWISDNKHLAQNGLNLVYKFKKSSVQSKSVDYFLKDELQKKGIDEIDLLSMCISSPLVIGLILRERVLNRKNGINEPKVNFLLDKLLLTYKSDGTQPELPFEGANGSIQALIFAETLSTIVKDLFANSQMISEEEKLICKLYEGLIKSLCLFAKWESDVMNHKTFKSVAKEIAELLKDKSIDFPILIPVGTKEHMVCLEINSKASELTICNGGDGLENHFRLGLTNLYRTQLTKIIDMNLLTEETIENFLRTNLDSNIQSLYTIFKQLPSLKEVDLNMDFENLHEKQERGSCTAEALKIPLRRLINDLFQHESLAQRQGAYMLFDSKISVIIASKNLEETHSLIRPHIVQSLKKHQAALDLMEAARNEENYTHYKNRFTILLALIGQKHFIDEMQKQNFKNFTERSWVLITCSELLASHKIQNPGYFEKYFQDDIFKHELLEFSQILFEEKKSEEAIIFNFLDGVVKNDDWRLLANVILETDGSFFKHQFSILRWVANHFKTDDEVRSKFINSVKSRARKTSSHSDLLQSLCIGLVNQQRNDLAELLM